MVLNIYDTGVPNIVLPKRPATAMDSIIKENVVPPVIRPKPQLLPVSGTSVVNHSDQVCSHTSFTDDIVIFIYVHWCSLY